MTSYNPNNPSCAAWFRALSGGGSLACAIGLEQFSPHATAGGKLPQPYRSGAFNASGTR